MDFGAVGLDHHHHHHHHHHHQPDFASNNATSSSDPETKQKTLMYGSEFSNNSIKQERSTSAAALEEYWRSSKLAKTSSGGDYDDKGMAFQQRNSHSACNNNTSSSLLRSNNNNFYGNNNNTSTSSTTTTLSFLDHGNYSHSNQQQHQMLSFSSSSSSSSPNYSNVPTLPYSVSAYATTRNSGYNNMNGGGGGGGGITTRSGGGFTASQWMELEHQALIFKYITANVPIPSNLLIPIRKAFDSSAAYASFSSAFLRPNPLGGRWGAFQLGFSNNADPEPGRCRRTDGKKWRCSRDAVADQKYCERHMNRGRHRSRKPVEGQVAAGSNSNNNSNANATVISASNKPAISAAAAGGASNSITSSNNSHHHHLQSFDIDAASNRTFAKENCTIFHRKQQVVTYDMSSKEFGLVNSVDSLLNPTMKHQNHNHHHEPSSQNSLHQFIDDWPNKPTRLDMDTQTDRTQLSISIPNIYNGETNLSPLRLSRQANWIPIAWETSSLGGPLGEVLNQPNNSSNNNNGVAVVSDHSKSSSSTPSSSVLNLMPEGVWDSSPPVGSSPTGVLQKTAFGSLSNSSAGSSPTRTNPAHDLLGVSSLPAL